MRRWAILFIHSEYHFGVALQERVATFLQGICEVTLRTLITSDSAGRSETRLHIVCLSKSINRRTWKKPPSNSVNLYSQVLPRMTMRFPFFYSVPPSHVGTADRGVSIIIIVCSTSLIGFHRSVSSRLNVRSNRDPVLAFAFILRSRFTLC